MNKDNRLIAEFMGAKMIVEDYHGINIMEFPDKRTFDLFGLKYNTSWDWLIPVIKQIRGIINTGLTIDEYDLKCGYSERLNPYDYDINSVHKGVVEFIKWFNQRLNQQL